MKVKFTVPTSKQDVPLFQFQEFHKIQELNKDADDGAFLLEKMVSIFCNVPMQDLRHIRYDQFELVVDELNKAFEAKPKHNQIIKIAGQKFGMIPNFDDISLGEYVDLDEYSKNVADYHKLMAVLYRPIVAEMNNTYEIEEYKGSSHLCDTMKHASYADTEGALLFFWNLANELLDTTSRFLQEMDQKNTQIEQPSEESTDGISPSLRSQIMTLLESAKSSSSIYTHAYTNYNLIKSVWTSNKERLRERETNTRDEAVL